MGHIQTHFVDDFCTTFKKNEKRLCRTTEELQVSEIRKVSESDVGIVVHCLVTRLRESASGKIQFTLANYWQGF